MNVPTLARRHLPILTWGAESSGGSRVNGGCTS